MDKATKANRQPAVGAAARAFALRPLIVRGGIVLPARQGYPSLLHWLGDRAIVEIAPRFEGTDPRAEPEGGGFAPGPPRVATRRGANGFASDAEGADCVAIAAWS